MKQWKLGWSEEKTVDSIYGKWRMQFLMAVSMLSGNISTERHIVPEASNCQHHWVYID